ncbi:substrate-binding and VWA domain-containing protein [Actinoplanes sp. NPDC051851]|uniref:substrate-binding and VWA domain-containing protein n=1 Tax=Actinoplanes sp. NPDC051851 TaxID=3154753 RepID=UPI00343404F9
MTEDDPLRPGRHRMRGRRRPRIAAFVALLLLLAGGGVGSWRYTHPQPTAIVSDGCTVRLRVVVAPEIAAVVQAAATSVNGGSSCGPIQVTAEEPGTTESGLKQKSPDVWIPSSSLWVSIAAVDGYTFRTDGAPLAHSPIVLAGPEAVMTGIAKKGKTSWAVLVSAAATQKLTTISMADPLHDSVGMLSVYAIHQAMNRTTADDGIAQLQALALRSRLTDATADPAKLLDAAAEGNQDVGVFPVTEQQLTAYQKAGHVVTLSGAVPADGAVGADYPYAMGENADTALAEDLREAISDEGLTEAGFRTSAQSGALATPSTPDDVLTMSLQWSSYRAEKAQVLLLIDGSGSMNQAIKAKGGRYTTKAALLRKTGASASSVFGEDTSIGLWYFATPSASSPAYTEALSYGPINGKVGTQTRREALATQIGRYTAVDDAGTPLYQTVLDGEDAMRAESRTGTVTLVVVLTDGQDHGSRFAMSNADFLAKLNAGQDSSRPVPIIAVGYGADADMDALTSMAKATGGAAVAATDPADVASAMAKAFLSVHSPS